MLMELYKNSDMRVYIFINHVTKTHRIYFQKAEVNLNNVGTT